jgi:transposase InsO family protein
MPPSPSWWAVPVLGDDELRFASARGLALVGILSVLQEHNVRILYERLNQKTAIQFADFLLDKFPFRVETIQTDNGSEFQSAFHWHLADRGIRHVYIKPATSRLNGKIKRSHRIDGDKFYRMLKGIVIDDAQLFNDKLAGMAALLQLPSPARRPRRPDPLRTPAAEDNHNDPEKR